MCNNMISRDVECLAISEVLERIVSHRESINIFSGGSSEKQRTVSKTRIPAQLKTQILEREKRGLQVCCKGHTLKSKDP